MNGGAKRGVAGRRSIFSFLGLILIISALVLGPVSASQPTEIVAIEESLVTFTQC